MELLLKDKVSIITGCDQGIGLEICKAFACAGSIVYATILRETSHDALMEYCRNLPGKVIPVCFDITDKKGILECIRLIKNRQNGQLDILVNNAGYKKDALVEMLDDESIMKMFDINVTGLIHMTQAALRLMKKNKNGGAIVNISSIVGVKGNVGQSVYGATKGAVASLTKSWAKEFVNYGIRVNAVAPGSIDTDMFYTMSEEAVKRNIDAIGMKRLGKPEEVASVNLFLASELASYVTGEIVGVDGGLFM